MADLTYQDVLTILRLIDTAGFAELEVEHEGTRIKVSRAGSRPALAEAPSKPQLVASPTIPVKTETLRPAVANLEPGDFAVKPPMEGTFYAAPSPGARPFASLGQHVRKGEQVGTVEVMKLFTPVISPCDGTVRAILVVNEQVIAKDETLMIVTSQEVPAP